MMRKMMLAFLAAGLLPAVSAADNIDKQLLVAAEHYEVGKPLQRIKKITYSTAEQNNRDGHIQINRQTDKFANVGMWSSGNAHVKKKTSSVKGRPDAKSLILLNHWELRWNMDAEGFVAQSIEIAPPPSQWSVQGGNFQSSAVLLDKNGRIFLKEQCSLGAVQPAGALNARLKGGVQQAQCKLAMSNENGTLDMVQDFDGHYLPDAQMFVPRTLLITNKRTGRIDKISYQIDKID